jgi:DNA polymerase I
VKLDLTAYRQIWFVDFEFQAPAGERQLPVCMIAHELHSGKILRYWQDELLLTNHTPIPGGKDCLLIAYYASAELGCYLVLNWQPPFNIIDLFAEYRIITNCKPGAPGASLLGALSYFDLNTIGGLEKDAMRQLVLRGGPWTFEERQAILDYCESDVIALKRLWLRMTPYLCRQSLVRGRYMLAVARMEYQGVPIDGHKLRQLQNNWDPLKLQLVGELDEYEIYDGTVFKQKRFANFLQQKGWSWPHTRTGRLSLSDDTFRDMTIIHPEIRSIHELRYTLSQLKLNDIAMGSDGRNRCLLSAFRSKSGRNQPSTSKFIFGPSTWVRSLIKPEPGQALAYVDWSQQEFGIAAALSGDDAMIKAYLSGDPYLEFAKMAGAAPANATRNSHSTVRDRYKQTLLAVNYMMGSESLSIRLGKSQVEARDLLKRHKQLFPKFWKWTESAVDYAQLNGSISARLGWTLHITTGTKVRTIQNFPMQANGSEMLRLACCFVTERGIKVCAPVHDALLVEAPINQIDLIVAKTQQAMSDAARIILEGFPLRTDFKIIKYPERYSDPRGFVMWKTINKALCNT